MTFVQLSFDNFCDKFFSRTHIMLLFFFLIGFVFASREFSTKNIRIIFNSCFVKKII